VEEIRRWWVRQYLGEVSRQTKTEGHDPGFVFIDAYHGNTVRSASALPDAARLFGLLLSPKLAGSFIGDLEERYWLILSAKC
jgi:hypothetical protein